MTRVGIDLGGTKIEVIALDAAGRELLRHRLPTPAGDYPATLAAIAALVELARNAVGGPVSIGIGTPGAASLQTGLIRNANSTILNGRPLQRDLQALLGQPVRLANDANCFAVSEAADGAGAGAAVVFGVILGTGVGGGLVVDGQLLSGANAIAGEWGHNPLPPATQLPLTSDAQRQRATDEAAPADCYCGRRGCIETWLSGPGLQADWLRHNAGALAVPQIVAAHARGEQAALRAIDDYVDRLARALGGVINLVDPDVIVLGGGLSAIDCLYEQVPVRWGRYVFSDSVRTRLVHNRHGDSSGVRGAAWLWPVAVTPA